MTIENNRDEFPAAVKTVLAGRVGWLCSFPDCNQSTSGPSLDSPEKMTKNGIAAHITAAAPGGPRYDINITPEQRSAIGNGIWMCPTHGTLIDKEKTAYSVDEIRAWKVSAEASARRSLESRQPEQMQPRYSLKDKSILEKYSQVLPYNVIERIRQEPFGSTVKHDITDPLYEVLDMESNPAYAFQDAELENLRQTLNTNVKEFFSQFSLQSGGLPEHYEYIDISGLTRRDPGSRAYWENEVYKTQDLARRICETAMQLLTIKENY